ncbi:MAG: acyl carrier protein [Planctomycetes bacterium]|nr:acyl carrier protein [Planctomycetota bacterium]
MNAEHSVERSVEPYVIPVGRRDRAGGEAPRATLPVREVIRRRIAQDFLHGRTERLTGDTPLVSAGIIDSAGVLHVVEWLEERFGIRVADDDVTPENFDTIDALARLVAVARARG